MSDAQIIGAVVVALVTIVGLGTAIVTPIIKLDSNITKLNATIERLIDDNKKQDERITKHGTEIDKLHDQVIDHEGRIKNLEKK